MRSRFSRAAEREAFRITKFASTNDRLRIRSRLSQKLL
jgi:hypothetical protein